MDAYRLALDQGREELAEAQKSLKVLTLRVSQLESIVAQLEAFTGGNTPTSDPFQLEIPRLVSTPVQTSSALQRTSVPPPLWKAIINALNGKKGNFTVPEAIAALERTGRHIFSENRTNIVRNTLIQNKAFGRLSPGHYYVMGYEEGIATNDKEDTEATS
jgi:hypothetical protein